MDRGPFPGDEFLMREPHRPTGAQPVVVYIVGSGRSGSTLLERTLGQMPGSVNVGELIDLFRREASRGERCSCGRPFRDCPFWASVGDRAFGGWADLRLAEMYPLQRRVARQRAMLPLLVMPLTGSGFRADTASYGEHYGAVYRAIADTANAACVVDASKWPVQALALHRGGIDVRVIHLVRDVRAVAHSHIKRGKRPPVTAVRWVLDQAQAEMLRYCGLPFVRVRYEDFVQCPRRTLETALTQLGLPCSPSQLEHLNDRQVVLSPSHGIHGNPSRFRHGEIALHIDEAWRERLSRRHHVVVTAIGLPLLLRYGWHPSQRRVAGADACHDPPLRP
jgi:hypothetical protein